MIIHLIANAQANNVSSIIEKYIQLSISYIPKIISALLILIIGLFIASWVKNTIIKIAHKDKRIDKTIGAFLASIAKWGIMALVLIAVLKNFGFETTSLAAILGATTLAVGLALQGTLGNVAAGFMLIIFRPYKLKDLVEIDGRIGVVSDINIFTTELTTPDNIKVIIANSQAWGSVIINMSSYKTRRIDLEFGIDYNDDINKAMKTILDTVKKDNRVLEQKEPWVRVTSLGDSSVNLTLRIWVKTADYWETKFDAIKSIKEAFDKNNISIPYPHQVEIKKD